MLLPHIGADGIMNFLLTSVCLGCVVAAFAQWILPGLLTGKFLETAAIASLVLIVLGIMPPRRRVSSRD